MEKQPTNRRGFRSFPPLFWLVVIFEFFERGSYYGMMSFISVYFVDVLNFPKENIDDLSLFGFFIHTVKNPRYSTA